MGGTTVGKTPAKELTDSLKELYASGKYSDLTISCGGRCHQVHKAVVCARSKFFAAACRKDFKEGLKGKVDLPEDDPQIVHIMVYYLYHLDYVLPSEESQVQGLPPINKAEDPQDDDAETGGDKDKKPAEESSAKSATKYHTITSELLTHAMVYSLADKYYIGGLKDLALRKFTEAVREQWTSYSFLEAAEEAYLSTIESDRGLRDVVVTTFYEHPELFKRKETQTTIKELGSLSYDLVMHIYGKKGWKVS